MISTLLIPVLLILSSSSLASSQYVLTTTSSSNLSRTSFPHGFVFGTATAAYQVLVATSNLMPFRFIIPSSNPFPLSLLDHPIMHWLLHNNLSWMPSIITICIFLLKVEGGVNEDGRGKSIWDTFSHRFGNPEIRLITTVQSFIQLFNTTNQSVFSLLSVGHNSFSSYLLLCLWVELVFGTPPQADLVIKFNQFDKISLLHKVKSIALLSCISCRSRPISHIYSIDFCSLSGGSNWILFTL